MKREKKIENFLRKLSSLSLINHNITFKDFSIIVGDKKINIPHEYIVIVKEIGEVDIEIRNANWGDGYIRTILNVVGNYDVDVFKNEDGVVINRIYAKDGNGCIVALSYIMYDKAIGHNNMHYLYIVKNNNKQQEAQP